LTAQYWDIAGDSLLIRRYTGGKVGRFTLNCEEGEPAKITLEDVVFRDIQHNVSGIPKYNAAVGDESVTWPCIEPFFFHGGTLTLNDTVFARVRGFTLEINNNVEGRYYWKDGNEFVPSEIIEGRREYSMTCKIDIEDTKLFEEIMQVGVYSDVLQGFQVKWKMERETDDYVEITLPTGDPSCPNHGCFIRRGKHDLVGDPLVTAELEILGRYPTVTVKTSESF
jgi:hypothetical protein